MSISALRRLSATFGVILVAGLCAAPVAGAAPVLAQAAVIDQKVFDDLAVADEAAFWVVLRTQADLSHAPFVAGWNARGQYVYEQLTQTAERTQGALRAELARRRVDYQSFWIVNAVRVTTDRATMLALASRTDVARIAAAKTYRLPQPQPGELRAGTDAIEWNITRINAPQVWSTFGVRGEGVVVANIDTGVQYNHSTLGVQYRGNQGGGHFDHNYNWFDPSQVCTDPAGTPCDDNGHGTHTMGTMVGDDGFNAIGVAPGARWIAAKGCGAGGCTDQALLSSGQWMLAPTDLAGNGPRSDLRPNVINNSWGSDDGSDLFYQATVNAWIAAGIFPVFSNGNNGPACGTAGSPGSYDQTYSVGAFDINNVIASYSSRGPSPVSRNPKPNIAAPGSNIRSSVPFNAYGVFSGTSMAAPHVAGTVALMISAAPSLAGDITQIRQVLNQTAIDTSDLTCGGTATNNNVWGEGRLDAFAAVEHSPRDLQGTLAGTVSDALSQAPIAGAQVAAVGPADRNVLTDEAGSYDTLLPAGDYAVTASASGYVAGTANAQISANATTTRDFALTPVPTYAVAGIVRGTHGRALRGVIVTIEGTSIAARTDADGAYKLPGVPAGSYDVTADAGGCNEGATQTLVVDADAALDFALAPAYDAFGYTCNVVRQSYVPARTVLALTGDEAVVSVALPFPFSFYGTTYDSIFVTTNGSVTFAAPDVEGENESLPSGTPSPAIYAFWDDLLVDEQASVRTQVMGEAPERKFAIEWRNATFGDDETRRVNVELILTERRNWIVTAYRGIADDERERGGSATFGIESGDGDGLQYSFDRAMLESPGGAIAYVVR